MGTKAPAHHLGVWRDCGWEMAQERWEVWAVLLSSQQEAEIIQDRTGFITEETRLKLHLHCCVGRRACIFLPTTAHRKSCLQPRIMEMPSRLSDAFLVQGFIHSLRNQLWTTPGPWRASSQEEQTEDLRWCISPKKSNEQPTRRDFCLVTLNTRNQWLQGAQSHRRSKPESKYIYLIKCTWLHYHCLKIDSTPGHTISLTSSPFPFGGNDTLWKGCLPVEKDNICPQEELLIPERGAKFWTVPCTKHQNIKHCTLFFIYFFETTPWLNSPD